jgi:hypothetical protein
VPRRHGRSWHGPSARDIDERGREVAEVGLDGRPRPVHHHESCIGCCISYIMLLVVGLINGTCLDKMSTHQFTLYTALPYSLLLHRTAIGTYTLGASAWGVQTDGGAHGGDGSGGDGGGGVGASTVEQPQPRTRPHRSCKTRWSRPHSQARTQCSTSTWCTTTTQLCRRIQSRCCAGTRSDARSGTMAAAATAAAATAALEAASRRAQ